jgi:isopentenyl phosphate kinase
MPVIVVKLGGSLITHKDAKGGAVRYASLRAAAKQAAAVLSMLEHHAPLSHENGLVLVHGAGSYGHGQAKEYDLASGGGPSAPPRHVAVGAALTRAAVRELNSYVCHELAELGVPVQALSPADADWAVVPGSHAFSAECRPRAKAKISALLDAGLVPVIHGDVVEVTGGEAASSSSSSCRRLGILSGDIIVEELGVVLGAAAIIAVTDVQGLFTAPPDEPGSKLVREVVVARPVATETGGIVRLVVDGETLGTDPTELRLTARADDVTGGIREKVNALVRLVRSSSVASVAMVGLGSRSSDKDTSPMEELVQGVVTPSLECSIHGTVVRLSEGM